MTVMIRAGEYLFNHELKLEQSLESSG